MTAAADQTPPRPTRLRRAAILAAITGIVATGLAGLEVAADGPALPAAPRDADYRDHGAPTEAKVALGRALFFDKILSGNRNIACATCHHPTHASGDGLSLAIGEGGTGLGPARTTGTGETAIPSRVPRSSPTLFNVGAITFTRFFHDGRVAETDGRLVTPAGADLPPGLDSALAAQALFPITSPVEMAGQSGENPVGDAAEVGDLKQVWALLADRLSDIPGYRELFDAAYGIAPGEITMAHAANAIAAFEEAAFRSDQSPFDAFLRGDADALDPAARRGMSLFYGAAGCAACHAGPFQTDHEFHALGMPQIGPGKGYETLAAEDTGRALVSGDPADRFAFRTPSLRNVALTAPYGHAGGYGTLEAVVHHHLDPARGLETWDSGQVVLPAGAGLGDDFVVMADPAARAAIAKAAEAVPAGTLGAGDVADIMAFLHALTDPAMTSLTRLVPDSVPSGLPVAD